MEVLHFTGGEIIPRRVLCPWRAHLLASTLPAVARATAACFVKGEWVVGRGLGILRGPSSGWCVSPDGRAKRDVLAALVFFSTYSVGAGRGAPRRAPRRRVRKQTLWSQSPPTRRWSLVGGADEHLAARDPAASVSRLVTAQCALDCSLIQWCFGRRARARRDDRRVDRGRVSSR